MTLFAGFEGSIKRPGPSVAGTPTSREAGSGVSRSSPWVFEPAEWQPATAHVGKTARVTSGQLLPPSVKRSGSLSEPGQAMQATAASAATPTRRLARRPCREDIVVVIARSQEVGQPDGERCHLVERPPRYVRVTRLRKKVVEESRIVEVDRDLEAGGNDLRDAQRSIDSTHRGAREERADVSSRQHSAVPEG